MADYPDLEISGEIPEEPDVKITAQAREELHREPFGSAEPPNDTEHMEFPERDQEGMIASSGFGIHGGMLHDELFEKDTTEETAAMDKSPKTLPEEFEEP